MCLTHHKLQRVLTNVLISIIVDTYYTASFAHKQLLRYGYCSYCDEHEARAGGEVR